MARFGSGRNGSIHGWPLFGLLLVLTFLGHDLLMAMEAHAAAPARHSLMERHATVDDAPGAGTPITLLAMPLSHHPGDCSVGQRALPRTSGESNLVVAVPFPHATLRQAPLPGFAAGFGWDEPTWPPGARRALYQVYQI